MGAVEIGGMGTVGYRFDQFMGTGPASVVISDLDSDVVVMGAVEIGGMGTVGYRFDQFMGTGPAAVVISDLGSGTGIHANIGT